MSLAADNQTSMLSLAFSAALIALTVSYTVDAEPLNSATHTTQLALAPVTAAFEPPTLAPSAIVLDAAPAYRQEEGLLKLYFAPSKTDIPAPADAALENVVTAIRKGYRVQISGFHDATGNPKQNLILSQKRAQAVQKRLIALGAPAKAIEIKKPSLVANASNSATDLAQARRVEVALLGKPNVPAKLAHMPEALMEDDRQSAASSLVAIAEPPLFRQEEGVVKLYFGPSKTQLPRAVDTALAEMAQAAKNGQQLWVSGFHDETGNPAQNIVLSQKRAQKVQNRLVALGAPASAIAIKAPVVAPPSNSHAEARRVEVALAPQ